MFIMWLAGVFLCVLLMAKNPMFQRLVAQGGASAGQLLLCSGLHPHAPRCCLSVLQAEELCGGLTRYSTQRRVLFNTTNLTGYFALAHNNTC
jgi:hypothetical protein